MEPASIGTVFSTISSTLKAGRALLDQRDEMKSGEIRHELQTSLLKLQDWVLNSQKETASLLEEIATLKEEIAKHREQKRYGDNYVRTEIAKNKFAYVEKSYVGSFGRAHKYCANCFEEGKYSTLDTATVDYGGEAKTRLSCNRCKLELSFPVEMFFAGKKSE